jgi:hypothetical protein
MLIILVPIQSIIIMLLFTIVVIIVLTSSICDKHHVSELNNNNITSPDIFTCLWRLAFPRSALPREPVRY